MLFSVPGVAYEILDRVRANKLALTVVDGSMAIEGDGPTEGSLVPMELIVAGTNPLAPDMVAVSTMGFEPQEVATFTCAMKSVMRSTRIDEIEIRGDKREQVRRHLKKPNVIPWSSISKTWGVEKI